LHHWKVETMHQYKDNALLEDDHNAHLNPFLIPFPIKYTIL